MLFSVINSFISTNDLIVPLNIRNAFQIPLEFPLFSSIFSRKYFLFDFLINQNVAKINDNNGIVLVFIELACLYACSEPI